MTTTVRTRRPELRRAEILNAALDLFSERGYHATGVADIATALSMSHGTFYRYFNSKRDILEQLIDEAADRVAANIADARPPSATLDEYRDQVRRIADALFAVVHDDPRLARLLLLEATAVDSELTERVLALLDHFRELTARFLRRGVEQGFLSPDLDCTETARAVNGIVFAGALASVRAGDAPKGYPAAAIRLIFEGLT